MAKQPLAISLLIASATVARADPSEYICVVEHAAGLHYDEQSHNWSPQAFGTRNYVFRKLTDADRDKQKTKWAYLLELHPTANSAFFYSGTDMPLATCVYSIDSVMGEQFNCEPKGAFDKDSRRFKMIYDSGYINQAFWEQFRREHPQEYKQRLSQHEAATPDHPDDLFIEIGRCSPS